MRTDNAYCLVALKRHTVRERPCVRSAALQCRYHPQLPSIPSCQIVEAEISIESCFSWPLLCS